MMFEHLAFYLPVKPTENLSGFLLPEKEIKRLLRRAILRDAGELPTDLTAGA